MKKEEWRSIKGYEGLYEVSDLGRVRSLEREDWIMPYWGCGERVKRVRAGKILIPRIGSNKYLRVCLSSHHCQKKDQQIHRLVATAFLPNQREKTQVNHKNGERNDNRLINLEWATASENIKHAYLTGLNKGRTGCKDLRLSTKEVLEIREKYKYGKQKELAREYHTSPTTISRVINHQVFTNL